MHEKFKNVLWVVFGGYGIGLLTQRGYDSARGIPQFNDSALIELNCVLYGSAFIMLWLWMITTISAMMEHKPWVEANQHWERSYPAGNGKFKLLWLLFRSSNTIVTYLIIYFVGAYVLCSTMCGGYNKDSKVMFSIWFVYTLLSWLVAKGQENNKLALEPDTLERNLAALLDLPLDRGKFVIITIIVSLTFGVRQYPVVTQAFGGGKPEKVIIVLKEGLSVNLPSGETVEGKVVELAFRRGNKLGFKAYTSSNNRFVVIDQDKIDKMYVGEKLEGLNVAKYKIAEGQPAARPAPKPARSAL